MKKIITVLLAVLLMVSSVGATCPTFWNDPGLTCITSQNWHDFVNNWTYQNTSIWLNFGNFLSHSGGTMTGKINAGGFNISNIGNPGSSQDAVSLSYLNANPVPNSSYALKNQIPSAASGNVITGTGSGIQDSGVLLSSLDTIANQSAVNNTIWSNFGNYDTNINATARNTSIWSNFGNYATISLLNSVNQSQTNNLTSVNNTAWVNFDTITHTTAMNTSIWTNFQNYETVVNASATNASIWYALGNVSVPVDYTGLFLQNGTRIMTGSLNTGGFNISNISTPVASSDAATKSYVDSHSSPGSPNTVYSALTSSQDGNITVWNGTSTRWLNDSGYTIPSLIAAVPIVNSSYATTTYVNSMVDTWNVVTTSSASLAVGNGYIPTNTSRTLLTLPVVASPGQSEKITGFGSGGWVIKQNAGQTIYFAGSVNTTPGTPGNVTSNTAYDSISLRCVVTNMSWVAELFTGNLQVN